MRDVEKTIGNIIDKQSICYISYIDSEEYPNTRVMLKPRKKWNKRNIFNYKHFFIKSKII